VKVSILSFAIQPDDLNLDFNTLEIERVTAGGVGDDIYDATGKTDVRIVVNAGTGNDTVLGSELNDTINGQDGDDFIEGHAHNDTLYGAGGNDTLRGGAGNDIIYGDSRVTTTLPVGGDDVLEGGEGGDNLIGGAGNDTITGGKGNDTINGGVGTDTAIYSGVLADYQFGVNNHLLVVSDTVIGRDGQDNVHMYHVENLQFSDVTLAPSDVITMRFDNIGVNEDAAVGDSAGTVTLNNALSGTLTWSLTNDNAGRFTIDSATGELIVADDSNLDTETNTNIVSGAPGHFVDVQVTNGSTTNTIEGGEGADNLAGFGGNDIIRGDAGNDTLTGHHGNDVLEGGDGSDTIRGNEGDDILDGGNGGSNLTGGVGADTFIGGTGNDVVNDYNPTEDVSISLGGGIDTLIHDRRHAGINVNHATYAGEVERTRGTRNNDIIDWSAQADQLTLIYGFEGNDTLTGTDVNAQDQLFGGEGDDTIFGGAGGDYIIGDNDQHARSNSGGGDDELHGEAGNDRIYAGAGDDLLFGGEGSDTLQGQAGDDVLEGGDGNDQLYGQGGSDRFLGGGGNDTIHDFMPGVDKGLNGIGVASDLDGGDGIDRLVITSNSIQDLNIDLASYNLERVDAAGGNDILDGSNSLSFAVTILGYDGNDQIIGSQHNDNLQGGDGNDIITGDDGNDTIHGGLGVDSLSGGQGNDRFVDYDNTDTLLDGGDGYDYLRVDSRSGDITVDMTAQGIEAVENGYGGRGDDVYDATGKIDFAISVYAGWGDDTVIGTQLNDTLVGQEGDDTLNGGDGNDVLNGGEGSDIFIGGAGNDTVQDFSSDDISIDLGDGTDTVTVTTDSQAIEIDLAATGIERFTSGVEDDVIDGSGHSVNLVINGNRGDDTMLGGTGNDIFFMYWGNDVVDGGAGINEVRVQGLQSDYLVSANGNHSFTITDLVSNRDDINVVNNVRNIRFTAQNRVVPLAEAVTDVTVEGDDELYGGDGNDQLFGNGANDVLIGNSGNDILTGGSGADTHVGGSGFDTSVFTGDLDDYLITYNGDGTITVVDYTVGRDGTDTVSCDIEQLQFTDLTVDSSDYCIGVAVITVSDSGPDAVEGLVHESDLAGQYNEIGVAETLLGNFGILVPNAVDSIIFNSNSGATTFTGAELNNANVSTPLVVNSSIGVLAITGYDSTIKEVTYQYTLTGLQDHETHGDIQDSIVVSVADTNSDSASGELKFEVCEFYFQWRLRYEP